MSWSPSRCPVCLRSTPVEGWCWHCRPEPPEGDALPWLWVIPAALLACAVAISCGLWGGL